jgi:hypothetical protein
VPSPPSAIIRNNSVTYDPEGTKGKAHDAHFSAIKLAHCAMHNSWALRGHTGLFGSNVMNRDDY